MRQLRVEFLHGGCGDALEQRVDKAMRRCASKYARLRFGPWLGGIIEATHDAHRVLPVRIANRR
ncbi:hypothetical protein ACFX5Q_32170 [Mesorhizobium sp. IMUNJ 23033]